MGSSLIIAVITAWIVSQLPYQRWNADHSTEAQQWQQNILSDQSSIQMAGQTAYNLQYNLDQRKYIYSKEIFWFMSPKIVVDLL